MLLALKVPDTVFQDVVLSSEICGLDGLGPNGLVPVIGQLLYVRLVLLLLLSPLLSLLVEVVVILCNSLLIFLLLIGKMLLLKLELFCVGLLALARVKAICVSVRSGLIRQGDTYAACLFLSNLFCCFNSFFS